MGAKYGLYVGWDKSSKFSFQIVSMVAAAVKGRALSWYKMTSFVSIPLHLLRITHGTILCTMCTTRLPVHNPGSVRGQACWKFHNSINIALPAEGTLLNYLVLGNDMCFHFTLCRFTEVHPCFVTCDNPLQESLSFLNILLQKSYPHFHVCLFMPSVSCFGTHLSQILWRPRSTDNV